METKGFRTLMMLTMVLVLILTITCPAVAQPAQEQSNTIVTSLATPTMSVAINQVILVASRRVYQDTVSCYTINDEGDVVLWYRVNIRVYNSLINVDSSSLCNGDDMILTAREDQPGKAKVDLYITFGADAPAGYSTNVWAYGADPLSVAVVNNKNARPVKTNSGAKEYGWEQRSYVFPTKGTYRVVMYFRPSCDPNSETCFTDVLRLAVR